MIKVAIVDDQELITEGLKRILSSYQDIEVTATGRNGEEALAICKKGEADVMLLDIRMPQMNGVETMRHIHEGAFQVKVMMLTTFEDEDYIVQAVSWGASGYLYKDIPYDKLAQCIRQVSEGQFVMPQKAAQVLAKNMDLTGNKKKEENLFDFTEREQQIVEMIEEGFNNKQIAKALYITEGTVKNYVSNIYSKAEVSSRVELINKLK